MNREEFLRQFREALDGKVSENIINDNIDYYRTYINGQIESGRSEPEVLSLLGEPRLLAKTIEESNKFASQKYTSENQGSRNGYANNFGNNYEKYDNYDSQKDNIKNRYIKLPGWLVTCLVMIAVVLLVTVLFNVFIYLAPFIFMFLAVGFLIKTVRSWWNNK